MQIQNLLKPQILSYHAAPFSNFYTDLKLMKWTYWIGIQAPVLSIPFFVTLSVSSTLLLYGHLFVSYATFHAWAQRGLKISTSDLLVVMPVMAKLGTEWELVTPLFCFRVTNAHRRDRCIIADNCSVAFSWKIHTKTKLQKMGSLFVPHSYTLYVKYLGLLMIKECLIVNLKK